MKNKLKKLLSKEIKLIHPEKIFNRKAITLAIVILALSFDLLILKSTQSFFSSFDKNIQTINPLEIRLKTLVRGHPIERMIPFIKNQNKQTMAFLIGIAKKESDWGRYSPKLNGKDCYNYWGYRGQGENITPSGYTCFKNPEEAVTVVGKRITDLVNNSGLTTPSKMIVWKCGWDCSQHSDQSVQGWIADVGYYYKKVYQ
jgi:hypothetical protein